VTNAHAAMTAACTPRRACTPGAHLPVLSHASSGGGFGLTGMDGRPGRMRAADVDSKHYLHTTFDICPGITNRTFLTSIFSCIRCYAYATWGDVPDLGPSRLSQARTPACHILCNSSHSGASVLHLPSHCTLAVALCHSLLLTFSFFSPAFLPLCLPTHAATCLPSMAYLPACHLFPPPMSYAHARASRMTRCTLSRAPTSHAPLHCTPFAPTNHPLRAAARRAH